MRVPEADRLGEEGTGFCHLVNWPLPAASFPVSWTEGKHSTALLLERGRLEEIVGSVQAEWPSPQSVRATYPARCPGPGLASGGLA